MPKQKKTSHPRAIKYRPGPSSPGETDSPVILSSYLRSRIFILGNTDAFWGLMKIGMSVFVLRIHVQSVHESVGRSASGSSGKS